MPLSFIRADITSVSCDAIVNAANPSLLGGGGVDGAIHRAAGPELLEACRKLGGCQTGEVKETPAFRLPAKFVLHTVGPVWHGGKCGERELLFACYRNSLLLAEKLGCQSVAFPLISSGIYGYPKREALEVAEESIRAFLTDHDLDVTLVFFDRQSFLLAAETEAEIRSFISESEVDAFQIKESSRLPEYAQEDSLPKISFPEEKNRPIAPLAADLSASPVPGKKKQFSTGAKSAGSLDEYLQNMDEGFSRTLLRLIDEKGMSDVECYKRANIDRKLFSKIRSDAAYKPKKQTVIAFAVALKLDLSETQELLKKAGFALSHSNRFDLIIEYFLLHRNWDIDRINEALFAFDQVLLGV